MAKMVVCCITLRGAVAYGGVSQEFCFCIGGHGVCGHDGTPFVAGTPLVAALGRYHTGFRALLRCYSGCILGVACAKTLPTLPMMESDMRSAAVLENRVAEEQAEWEKLGWRYGDCWQRVPKVKDDYTADRIGAFFRAAGAGRGGLWRFPCLLPAFLDIAFPRDVHRQNVDCIAFLLGISRRMVAPSCGKYLSAFEE